MEKNVQPYDPDFLKKIEAFTKTVLAVPPDEKEILTNKAAKNAKFLPVSNIENTLDEVFFGLWETVDFHYQVVANEIIGSIVLRVFHPIACRWISRTGAAAVQIQMISKERGGDGDISNVRNKIVNTLVKDFPHLKSECLKNAAKSVGKIFGRDLNREAVDDYQPITGQIEFKKIENDLQRKLNHCYTTDELEILWEGLEPEHQRNAQCCSIFSKPARGSTEKGIYFMV